MDQDTRTWAVILHLSTFAGALVPMAGLVAPILIWQLKKNDLPELDAHGKIVTNFILSFMIYSAISVLLAFVLIGIPLLFLLGLLGVIFPIIGAVKASNNEAWPYPLTIKFFS